jgi:hypothetical protein
MSKMLKTSADNRKCIFPNCTQILSIYNHDTYCHMHRDEAHHGQSIDNLKHNPGQSPYIERR